MIIISTDSAIAAKFNTMRAELADLAYELECQGRCDAADITNQIRAQLVDFAAEFCAGESRGLSPSIPGASGDEAFSLRNDFPPAVSGSNETVR